MNEQEDRANYWATVKDIAKEALEAEQRGEDAHDYIHESVDGSHYVIYTHANVTALQESENESAAFDDMGADALAGCDSYSAVMARLAYYAMSADVHQSLEELREEAKEAES
jgi:hypothetical protein